MSSDLIVELERVEKRFQLGTVPIVALNGVDMAIERGAFVAITGPSGSGKSTLLNLIGCLESPTGGRVLIDGQDVNALSETERDRLRRDQLGLIFQAFNLIPVLNARENVELPLQLRDMTSSERRSRAEAALNSVGMSQFAKARPETLSGGQRQRVAIARALVTAPKLVLADEPTASLDTANAMSLVELMLRLNVQEGVTFILATHDDRLLNHVSDVKRLEDGQLKVAEGDGVARPLPASEHAQAREFMAEARVTP